jgi:hypothetical protein
MPSLEECFEDSDKLSQEVVRLWEENFPKSNAPEFQALLDKALFYQSVRKIAEYRQQIKKLSGKDEVEVKAARLAFAKAFMALDLARVPA